MRWAEEPSQKESADIRFHEAGFREPRSGDRYIAWGASPRAEDDKYTTSPWRGRQILAAT
jgi:hypothetical protein